MCLILLTTGVAWALSASTPSIWIDDPLDGAILAMSAPVDVIGHVSDPNGVEQVRLEVDNVEVASSETATSPGSLATVQFSWQPDVAGPHTLGLWVKAVGSDWVGPAVATVSVVEEASSPTTTAGTATTTPTTTATTVPTTTATTVPTTACGFGVPTPVNPADNAVIDKTGIAASVSFSWSYSGCSPDDLVFHIQLSADPGFFTDTIVWNTTTAGLSATSDPTVCGDYWWRVRVRTPVVSEWSSVNTFVLQGACS